MMQAKLQPKQSIEARELLNLSQIKVARETGIDWASLSLFERGERMLNNEERDVLLNYYDELGLDVAELKQAQEPNTPPAKTMIQARKRVTPVRIREGMVISPEIDDETLNKLMEEYYLLDEQILMSLDEPVSRGMFGFYRDHTVEIVMPLLLACYRQQQIKSILQGEKQKGLSHNEISADKVYIAREFLEYEIARISKAG